MKLETIAIKNYRSIEEISFNISPLTDQTYTYGLIGVNEAGKSTILKALALKDGLKNEKGEKLPLAKDFRDKTKDIEIEYTYKLDKAEIAEAKESIKASSPEIDFKDLDLSLVKYITSFTHSDPKQTYEAIEFLNIGSENELKEKLEELLREFISKKVHKSIFWTAEDRYLISQPINLAEFAANPDSISIPLKNCFALAGISGQTAIQEKIGLISDSTEREQLKTELSEKVSEHINSAWPKHPIKITFDISDGLINFHVHDEGAKGKAKTADQRSDGFRQFVSFLLTISAQSKNEELSNSILLLDEPETHLHPQAQEDLLKELVKITDNKRNNVVFFATHSNYMIDKSDLSRNYRIFKKPNKKTDREKTEVEQFDKTASTYAGVTYQVFDIASTDYHNELYSKLHEKYQDEDQSDDKRCGILNFDTNFFVSNKKLKKDKPWKGNANQATLPTYIRNCIHHSDNGDTYKDEDLRKSIDLLISYL